MSAHYGGDGTFAPSDSTPVSITIARAATSLTAQTSLTSLAAGDSVTLSSTVATTSRAASPTGTIAFNDSTSGAILATATLSAAIDGKGDAIATAHATVPAQLLLNGANSIVASYSGDTNYLASTAPALAITYIAPFNLSLANSTLTIPAQGSASAAVTVTASSSAWPQPVFLACPQTLPTGLSCAFSPAVLPAGSKSATSTLTIYASSALVRAVVPARPRSSNRTGIPGEVSLASVLLMMAASRRRRIRQAFGKGGSFSLALLLAGTAGGALLLSGCGGAGISTGSPMVQLGVSSAIAPVGIPVTFTATVTNAKSGPLGQGPIAFIENGATIGTGTLNAKGVASYSTSSLSVGPHSVAASYPGSGNELPANSAPVGTDITFTTPVLLSASDSSGNSSDATLSVTVK